MTRVDIISGFLGAGKTTLIKKLLKEALTGEKVVLIENEFGEIGIDGGFLKEAGIQITEMNSGCICCSLVGDFGTALKDVLKKFSPDRIIIEPSGVGKLSDVAKAVLKVRDEEPELQLGSLTTVADANKCRMYMKNFGEFYNNQVEAAQTIVLSRTGDMAPEKVEAAAALLREKNEKAVIITTDWKEITGRQILEAMEHTTSLAEELLAEEGICPECGHHHHHHADEVFVSWGQETARKYTEEEIREALEILQDSTDYGTVLRAKGILPLKDGEWIHFDLVPGEYEIRRGAADYTGRLCVIGAQLKTAELAQLFHL